ncbi:hypothetical protein [Streptomyces sp. URMC 123]|uniref:hypothetical protein n=1 Tax=Streptomyces sp. URMC 123 TaxID=3423403 RepID=UPI003F1BDD71
MAADAPFAGHNPAAVLLLVLAGLITTACFGIYGVIRLFRRPQGLAAGLRTAGILAFTGAVGIYTWGLLHLVIFDESIQAEACRQALDGKDLVAYEPSYIPLAFGCVAGNGKTYDVAVPGYVNPAAGLLGVTAFFLTAFSFVEAHNDKKEKNT